MKPIAQKSSKQENKMALLYLIATLVLLGAFTGDLAVVLGQGRHVEALERARLGQVPTPRQKTTDDATRQALGEPGSETEYNAPKPENSKAEETPVAEQGTPDARETTPPPRVTPDEDAATQSPESAAEARKAEFLTTPGQSLSIPLPSSLLNSAPPENSQ